MADEHAPEATAPEAGAKPKKKKSKLLLIIALVVVIAGVGGAVYAMRRGGGSAEAAAPTRGMVQFDPFVVNLADPGGMRFIRVTMQLVTYDEKTAKELTESPLELKQARSIILEILSQQLAADLVKVEGKAALKKSIIARVSEALKDKKVVDVFFSEFVVQF